MNLNQLSLSHKVRTPLTTTLMILEGLYSKIEDEAIKRTFMVVISEINLLICLFNDLMDLKLLDSREFSARKEVFDVKSIFEFIITMFAQQAELQRSSVQVEVADDEQLPAALIGDKMRLKQVLVNLVKNALKFCQATQVTIKATFDSHDQLLIVQVIDYGKGISASALKVLNEYFEQQDLDKTTNAIGCHP